MSMYGRVAAWASQRGAVAPTRPDAQTPRRSLSHGNLEFYSWLFFRVSGLLLILLALGHFAIMHVFHSILDVDYDFVVRRWAMPAWRAYDWLLLVLTVLHGFNGLRVVVNEYVRPRGWWVAAQSMVGALTVGFLILGTYVVIAFQAPVR